MQYFDDFFPLEKGSDPKFPTLTSAKTRGTVFRPTFETFLISQGNQGTTLVMNRHELEG